MDDDEMVFDAFMAGANGYLLKEESGHNIIQALRDTLEGGAGMSPSIAYKVLKMMKQGSATLFGKKKDYNITKRELEILTQLKAGLSYDKIGQNLFISTGTVRKHLENIYKKLQVHNKIEAVNIASKGGLI
jgi:DNA-binding NarL/FixJ family response regulator